MSFRYPVGHLVSTEPTDEKKIDDKQDEKIVGAYYSGKVTVSIVYLSYSLG